MFDDEEKKDSEQVEEASEIEEVPAEAVEEESPPEDRLCNHRPRHHRGAHLPDISAHQPKGQRNQN